MKAATPARVTLADISRQPAAIAEARRIYHESFPPEERRPWPLIERRMADGCPRLRGVMADGRMVGLITTWQLGPFVYVEHFAMSPAVRGLGLGALALQAVAADSLPLPLLLEVEPDNPADPLTGRRIDFYRRGDLEVVGRDYVQPPYAAGLPPVPLWLMSTDPALDPALAATLLHRHVYGVK